MKLANAELVKLAHIGQVVMLKREDAGNYPVKLGDTTVYTTRFEIHHTNKKPVQLRGKLIMALIYEPADDMDYAKIEGEIL